MNLLTDAEFRDAELVLADARPEHYRDALGGERFMAYMASKGQRSLYFFCLAILGYKDFVPHLHKPLCDFAQDPTKLRRGYLIPRGHFKSSAISVGKRTHVAIFKPDSRSLIVHEKAGQAEGFLGQIKSHLERNALLRALYPDRMPPVPIPKGWRWTQSAMVLPRDQEYPEATITATGWTAALHGLHFDHMDLDDLIGEEAAGNPEVMQKVIDWLARAESLSVVPATLELDMVGTRWAYWDAYQWAMDGGYPSMEWFHRSAIVKDETGNDVPLFPERFTMEGLMELRRRDFVSFSCQYLNAPVTGTTSEFETRWLRYYRQESRVVNGIEQAVAWQMDYRPQQDESQMVPLANMEVLIQVDPGLGITQGRQKAVARHSRSAIIVVGLAWPRRVFVLHVWAEMQGVPELCKQVLRFFQVYDRQVRKIVIERHSWTRMVRPTLLEEARKQNILLTDGRIHDFTGSSNTQKDVRIRALQPFFQKGMVFLEENMVELEREYRDFPLGKSKDIMDALSQGCSENLWRFPQDEEESPWQDNDPYQQMERDRTELGASPVSGY